ncbi:MAG: GNAT family N-acetyltransferase [Anaerolineales bacterium]|nr:GNAT family N-acetyltransferase [Anaerolineales bacterium]
MTITTQFIKNIDHLTNSLLKVTTPAPREVWQGVLERDKEGLVTQTPAWIDCICASGPYEDASRLYEFKGGRQLILPMVRRKGVPGFLNTEASMPYAWGMGGLVGAQPIQTEEVANVIADLSSRSVLRTLIRPNPRHGPVWAAAAQMRDIITIPRSAHVLDLEGGFDHVWNQCFHSTTRRNVRKANRSDLVVESDTTGKLVSDFYNLFQKSLDRWANQQNEPLLLARWRGQRRDPIHKFQRMAEVLGEACRIWVARISDQPVAAILVLQGTNAHYTRGAMNKELAGPTRANDLLHQLAIQEACRAGCRYYHMGESGESDSLANFKEKFGARPYNYAEYRLERLPVTNADHKIRTLVKQLIGFKDI